MLVNNNQGSELSELNWTDCHYQVIIITFMIH
jgi:hypothetical protein